MTVAKLHADACRLVIDPDSIPGDSTADVKPLEGIRAQTRALRALDFGLDIHQPRFHVVAVGEPGSGRTFSSRSRAKHLAKGRPTPDDLLLLPNPNKPTEPTVISLPAGEGRPFADAMGKLHETLVDGLRRVPEGERFKQVRSRVERRAQTEEAELAAALSEIGEELGLQVERGEDEVHVAAVEGEEPDEDAVRAITAAVEEFEEQLVELGERVEKELRDEVQRLMLDAVKHAFEPVIADFEGSQRIQTFLEDVHALVNKEIRGLVDEHEESGSLNAGIVVPTLLAEHEPGSGAPVVEVAYPTVSALFGRSHVPPDSGFPPEPGFAVPGALHKANGGYLIVPARTLLKNGVYEQLKACLLSGRFIPPEHDSTYFRGTVEELLFPQMPIDVKVVLVASPVLYQELHEADPEFSQLFKVQARFEHTFDLEQALQTYPAFLAGFLDARGLPPLTAAAVAELLQYGCRLVESRTKATAQLGLIAEVASEAAYLGANGDAKEIDDVMVRQALEAKHWRSRYFQDEVQRLLSDGTIRIEVEGAKVGQVNAISVLSDGPTMFGKPCRVTAVTYPGSEGPVNIAREVEMSGPIHAKGVLILKGFLAARFAQRLPLCFGASLVFEQTYDAIDGDSASTTELYALLSSLSGIPILQHYAVTGSVDQHGYVQPVGGLNEKIESFFDVCNTQGLTGEQGVLIPARNLDALVLRSDVAEAMEKGTFHIYAIETVEEGIELLTGIQAGELDEQGRYPDHTVYGAVQARLDRFRTVLKS